MFRNSKVVAGVVGAVVLTAGGMAYAAPRLTASHTAFAVAPDATTITGSIREAGFVPITPCRILDTRKAHGGILVPNVARRIVVGGTTGFVPQGGNNGGCGIPVGASAIAASLSATSITGTGIIHAWPVGAHEPNATVVNYNKTAGSVTTGQTLAVNPGTNASLMVKAQGRATQFVIDVTGYYLEPIAGVVTSQGNLGGHTNQVLSSVRLSTGDYQVTFAHPINGCAEATTAGSAAALITSVTVTSATTNEIHVANINGAPVDAGVAFTITC